MLILIAPVQPIAMISVLYDFTPHNWNSSWNNTAVHWMFSLSGWISDEDCPFTISCYIFQVLCLLPAIHFVTKFAVVTVSYFLFPLLRVSQDSHHSPSLFFSTAQKINQIQLFHSFFFLIGTWANNCCQSFFYFLLYLLNDTPPHTPHT